MLTAIDVETGLAVVSEEARRERRYLCPECRTLVGLRAGKLKAPYFAHYERRCRLSVPESPRHMALKLLCRHAFAPLQVEFEVIVGERRADVLVNRSFVVECQASALSVEEWRRRTRDHNRAGFPVLWLWDIRRLCGKNTLAEAQLLEDRGKAVWVPGEVRACQAECGGVIVTGDKHGLAACTCVPLAEGDLRQLRDAPATLLRLDGWRRLRVASHLAVESLSVQSGALRLICVRADVILGPATPTGEQACTDANHEADCQVAGRV